MLITTSGIKVTDESDDSFVNFETLKIWVEECLLPHVRQLPVLLIMDSHHAHVSTKAIAWCLSKGIILNVIPKDCTPFLQPLDTDINAVWRRHYDDQIHRTRYEHRRDGLGLDGISNFYILFLHFGPDKICLFVMRIFAALTRIGMQAFRMHPLVSTDSTQLSGQRYRGT